MHEIVMHEIGRLSYTDKKIVIDLVVNKKSICKSSKELRIPIITFHDRSKKTNIRND